MAKARIASPTLSTLRIRGAAMAVFNEDPDNGLNGFDGIWNGTRD